MSKSLIFLGIFAGSTIGGLIPNLWGADFFSAWGIIFSMFGALVGVWIVYKFIND